MALLTVNLTTMTSLTFNNGAALSTLRKGNPLNQAIVVLSDDKASDGSKPLEEQAIFVSAFHKAPWVRQDQVLSGVTVRVPRTITNTSARTQWLIDNGYLVDGKCLVNMVVPDYTYGQDGTIV